ncbi:xylose isomerase [Pseudobutyrivibrio sp. AR14]|uniref:Xylose isomerase n=2 Tax=Lachnospiraceae TaxID=186803 RepID=A0A2G3ED46_9FIRM|nr:MULTISPECIES: xylose isomerase [Pseudobutyrivibrio]PHU41043.1 xylose isomerase [Pseudobutyrivibrio ruminis]SCY10137.1 xylose isomerase [Pseudobutyrivibrio sp. AR14]
MGEFFSAIPEIKYEGKNSTNPFAFKYYDKDRKIMGKTMEEHLPFAMAWWHNLGANGVDMFGQGTADKSFGQAPGTMEHAKAKVDAGFEFMKKLGIKYFCFHDIDLVPEADDINETNRRLDEISDYILEKMKGTDIKCLWGTANMFGNPRYMNGAGSTNSADVYCFAAAQVKKALDITVKLGGRGYVFWGGREGYEFLLNTDMKFEQENIANLMHMAVDYGRSIGFKGDFYIEPKPKEPMKHQYDFDAATAIGFLRQYGLDKDFKMNIEANHATLAQHTFEHELRVSAINGMLGSIDANQGDPLLGWDTDEFPCNVYDATLAMYEVLKSGGLTGGFNFDSKNRRPSYTYEDMFHAFILGMDTFALGLIKAAELIEDGRIDNFVKEKYSSFQEGIGKKIRDKSTTLQECSDYALKMKKPELPGSGRQEYLEAVLNNVLFK